MRGSGSRHSSSFVSSEFDIFSTTIELVKQFQLLLVTDEDLLMAAIIKIKQTEF